MPKIHGAEQGEVAQEFFYEEADGSMGDANLHDPILFGGDHGGIDETIMAPIRKRFHEKYRKMQPGNKTKPKK